jgi:hypothetical protein
MVGDGHKPHVQTTNRDDRRIVRRIRSTARAGARDPPPTKRLDGVGESILSEVRRVVVRQARRTDVHGLQGLDRRWRAAEKTRLYGIRFVGSPRCEMQHSPEHDIAAQADRNASGRQDLRTPSGARLSA